MGPKIRVIPRGTPVAAAAIAGPTLTAIRMQIRPGGIFRVRVRSRTGARTRYCTVRYKSRPEKHASDCWR